MRRPTRCAGPALLGFLGALRLAAIPETLAADPPATAGAGPLTHILAPVPTLFADATAPVPSGAPNVTPSPATGVIWPGTDAVPINLLTAFRLAQTSNLDIAQAREALRGTQAALARAEVAVLPNLNLGSTYTHHEGNIAKTEGNIIKANKDSLFVGGGPSLSLATSDALFNPLIARRLTTATRSGLERVANNTLLAVADAYFNVLRARRRLARAAETLEYLTSEEPSPGRAGSRGLLPLVQRFVAAGGNEALRAELDRVQVEVLRRQEERAAAIQEFRLAAAELARLLRLDPATPLWPIEDFRFPLALPGDRWADVPAGELVRVALQNRPELAENRALVEAAVDRVRAAKARPLLPNLVLNYNWGDFGGGPDPNPPIIRPPTTPKGSPTVVSQPGFGPSGRIEHMNTRTDFDMTLVWRLQNFGAGDVAAVREQEAARRQAQLRLVQFSDRVVTEVLQAGEAARGWRERVEITARSLFQPDGTPTGPVFRSLRLNFERIRNVPGTRPLEVLDSIRGLNDALEAYGQAVTEYERSRIRLLVALGIPAQELFRAESPEAPAPAETQRPGWPPAGP